MNDSVIIPWNNIYLEAVRQVGGAPGPLSRVGVMMHIAMYDTINLLMGETFTSYTTDLPKPSDFPGAKADISAAFAARKVLAVTIRELIDAAAKMQGGGIRGPFDSYRVNTGFNPERFTEDRAQAFKADPSEAKDAAADDSQLFGEAVADKVLAARKKDGAENANNIDDLKFKLVNDPKRLNPAVAGEWRETGSGKAATPLWGKVKSFGKWPEGERNQFLPTAIDTSRHGNYADLLNSLDYAGQVNEPKRLGESHSAARTPEQTEIAFFWANDLDGTSKPPGQLYSITQTVARQEKTTNDLLATARLFALVGIAMADAGIISWYVKYLWPDEKNPLRLWRPETAIYKPEDDKNPNTEPDRRWQPLSPTPDGIRFSPPFPAYISGHATFGAAHAAMMRLYFKRDSITFTAATEDPHALRDGNGVRRTRRFTSFTEAARENGRSRIYLGVHYQIDAEGGFESGTKIAEYAFANVLKPKAKK